MTAPDESSAQAAVAPSDGLILDPGEAGLLRGLVHKINFIPEIRNSNSNALQSHPAGRFGWVSCAVAAESDEQTSDVIKLA